MMQAEHDASMRPRFVNRGKCIAVVIATKADPRFNEAAIRKSRKGGTAWDYWRGWNASMRPRFVNRGKQETAPTGAVYVLLQ